VIVSDSTADFVVNLDRNIAINDYDKTNERDKSNKEIGEPL
jgi:hypothetical protein